MREARSDNNTRRLTLLALLSVNLLLAIIVVVLIIRSWPVIINGNIFGSGWFPSKGMFGFLPFIIGTVMVTFLAMIIAVPICLLCAVYLSEYAHKKVKSFMLPVIDLLAGIPPVIYGLFGVLVVVPVISYFSNTPGYSLLAGGLILAIMVFPIIISVSISVLRSVPEEEREASLSLGATKWESGKLVVRKSAKGLFAAIIFGFSRALGETIAVMMVIGNVAMIPKSLLSPAYTLPALIANNYGEMMSIPLYDSALLFAALILIVVVAFFNIGAHAVLKRMELKGVSL